MKKKTKTIDEYCNKLQGTFEKFVAEQEKQLCEVERERKERIIKK